MQEKVVNAPLLSGGGTERNSNLELFRIITMLLIVAHHYVVNSGLLAVGGPVSANPLSWRSIFLLLFGAWGKTGINCFVLITGYFMCKSQISVKKFCKLLFEVEFYKIIIWAIFFVAGYESFSLSRLIDVILPVRILSGNFTGCYLIFFLFIPFLNILVKNMNEKQHIMLLMLCIFAYVIIGTIPSFGITMNYISWFIVLYFISSYIRLYDKKIFNNCKIWGFITLATLIVSVASILGMTWLGAKLNRSNLWYYFISDSNKILAVALAISSFLFFKNLKMKNSKFINTVAASSFGVLLIHANSDAMRRWLWNDLLNNMGMYQSQYLVLHAIGSVFAIYIICTIIDYLRIRFIEKPIFKRLDKYLEKLNCKFKNTEKQDV